MREKRLKKKNTNAGERSLCNSMRDEFLPLFCFSFLFNPSSNNLILITHPSMYASIWLCGASCDRGRSQLGSS